MFRNMSAPRASKASGGGGERSLLPKSGACAFVAGLALMPLVIAAGLWREAADTARVAPPSAPPRVAALIQTPPPLRGTQEWLAAPRP